MGRRRARRAAALSGALAAVAFALSPAPALPSASLQISPVLIDAPSGGSVATVNIRNDDPNPAPVQIRVFRWSQVDGAEKLEPTEAVVASPPIATIAPRASLNVRVIRAASEPPRGEEAYRLVIDQLPQSDASGRTLVAMLLRQVLPVFFSSADRGPPSVVWSVARGPRGYELHARNSGDRRLRVAKVTLSGGSGAPIAMGGGLLGYVLGHSQMSWTLPQRRASFAPGARVTLRGDSDLGALDVTAPVAARD